MVMYSVMAPVDRGDNNGNHLPLDPAERSRAPHQLNIKFVMLSHDSAVYSMDADDVVAIYNAVARRDLIYTLIGYECHCRLPRSRFPLSVGLRFALSLSPRGASLALQAA